MKQQKKTPEELKRRIFENLKYLGRNLREIADNIENFESEIDEAQESLEDCEIYAEKLFAENSELAKALDEVRKRRDELLVAANNDELKLRRELKDERLTVKRFQNALDAALNDVAIYRRAAFWFGVSSVLAIVVATF
ncbi:MAG: hypothetical protein IJO40_01320 [Thermoguttaceae bacterium]|nr:hypothetical protein [Thermoguttaceae bacterium]